MALATRERPWVVDFGTDERFVNYRGIRALQARLREQGMEELADKLDKTTVSGEEDPGVMDDSDK